MTFINTVKFYKTKKIKKYIQLIAMVLVFALALCGCAGADESSSDASSSYDYSDTEGQAKVGYIYNHTVSKDNMTYMFEKSRKDMQTALEIETCYVDNVPVSQFENAVKALKNDGCNIIISASNAFANSAYSYAKKDKDIYIISYGGAASLTNLTSIQPQIYQPAFVCGAAAAWNSSSHTIGVVADDTMYASYAVIDAFVLGVQQVYKVNETDVKLIFANTDSETASAVDSLVSAGCDVILSYQASDYAMYYCDSIGIKSIGFTSDVKYAAEHGGIMGFYLNWATYLTDTVRNCINDSFAAEVYVGGLKEAFVKVTPYTAAAKNGTDTICDTLYDYVKKGSAPIFEGELRDKDGLARLGLGTVLPHNMILDIDYLAYGITSVENYIQPINTLITPDLIPQTEFIG